MVAAVGNLLASDAFCKCICGSGKPDPGDATTTWATPDLEALEEVDEPLFQKPKIAGRQSYSIFPDQPLRGQPMREGELWFLSTEEKVDKVSFSLYINGFSFWHEEHEMTISLSPFALVRNCKFQSTYPNLGSLSDFKIFKVSLFAQGRCYYFGVRGEDEHQAEEDRSRWVLDLSRAMRLVTQSLFPPFRISCEPLPTVLSTHRRLMAGYLIHCDDGFTASVLYCELHPHCEDKAKMVLYENELCQTPVMDVYITERAICCEKIGINCSCFSIEDHQFSTRSLTERKLWLRAISNLKVKLQNRVPNPSHEELNNYRMAIREHISDLKGALEGQAPHTDPLLPRVSQTRKMPPPGDTGPSPVSQQVQLTMPNAASLHVEDKRADGSEPPARRHGSAEGEPSEGKASAVGEPAAPAPARAAATDTVAPPMMARAPPWAANGGSMAPVECSRPSRSGVSGPRLCTAASDEEPRQLGDG